MKITEIQSLCQQGRYADALTQCTKYCDENPADAQGWFLLGALHGTFDQYAAAEACCRKSIAIAPSVASTHYNLGVALLALGKHEEAEASLQQCIQLEPGNAPAHCDLGNARWELCKYEQAIEHYQQAIKLDPSYAKGYLSLGEANIKQGKPAEAIAWFQQYYQHSGDDNARVRATMALPAICESGKQIEELRARMDAGLQNLESASLRLNDPVKEILSTNFFLAYHGKSNVQLQTRTAQLYLTLYPDLAFDSVATRPAGKSSERPNGKIRIGFISRFLSHHSIGKTSRGLIEKLDRDRFEVIVIRFDEPADQTARAICEQADSTIVIPATLAEARTRITAANLDILFYQDIGMEPFTYLLAFSRLAPVQCTTFGHPDTTGIPNMDYFVSTDYYEPENAQAHYTETLFLLTDVASCAYYYRPALPDKLRDRSDFGLADDADIYICPQALFKLHPDFDDILAGILRADPLGTVVLIQGTYPCWQQQLETRFRNSMPDVANRIRFIEQQKDGDFTNLLAVSDVVLDPIHFGGQNTTHEALSAGTPIVTWPGEFHRGRHVYGFYRKMGFDDCIARDHEDYVSIAVRLANDNEFRQSVVAKIKANRQLVWEETRVVKEFERFFQEVAPAEGN